MNMLAARGAALLIGLVFSVSAVAQAMSKDQYNVRQTGISAEYKLAKAACDSFSGNAKDLCLAEASGKEKVATAELNARVAPSEAASYNVRLARADAAREKSAAIGTVAKDATARLGKP